MSELFLYGLVILFVFALSKYIIHLIQYSIIERAFNKGKAIFYRDKKSNIIEIISKSNDFFIISNKYKSKLFTNGGKFYPLQDCYLS